MTFTELKELVWDWHQHKTDAFSYPTTVIMNVKDYNELLDDVGRNQHPIDTVFPNKVTGLDVALWRDISKEPMIF